MADSKYFGIPFATSGDKATIPEATQPSGAISFTQGFGPDYERDPATDPLAKRVPRDETNELYFQLTNAVKFLQLYGTPEWYELDDAGNPVSYPLTARVRHDAGAGMQVWRSLVATNTATPGSDATKWAVDDPFSLGALEASLAEALAGTLGSKIITPRRLASGAQAGAWNWAGTFGGTANAITATITPTPASLSNGLYFEGIVSASNTGALTVNLNGLGVVAVTNNGKPLGGGELTAGAKAGFTYSSGGWVLTEPPQSGRLLRTTVYTRVGGVQYKQVDDSAPSTSGAGSFTSHPQTSNHIVEGTSGGSAGGGAAATSATQFSFGAGGNPGAYAEVFIPGQLSTITVTLGAPGVGASGALGGASSATSFGSLITLPGAGGGPASIATNSASVGTIGIPSGPPTVGGAASILKSMYGGGSAFAGFIIPSLSMLMPGVGGASIFGQNAYDSASGFGNGGGGKANGVSAPAQAGGNGGAPIIIVREYA